ncbi:MAG: hypothetical protein Q9196_005463 [Gyalolechia fulgens]
MVLNMIGKLANQTNVKICLSSRPLLVFEQAFSGKPSLKLQDLTFESIRGYAELKLSEPIQERASLDNANGQRVGNLLHKIVWRADGVFIWAVIAIRDIREGLREMASMNELAEMIESLPSELEKLYMRMLDRIKPAYKRDAVRFLQLVLYSRHQELQSGFDLDLCTLYFCQLQRGLEDTPFAYEAIATTELGVACRILKTRLQSHTAGLLELTPTDEGDRIYDKLQGLDHILFTRVNFVHRTVRDFLLNNAEARSLLTHMGSTEAQVRLSIAKGILAQIAHCSQGGAEVVDEERTNPVYVPFLTSLVQISLSERLLGVAQVRLMQSLDFATFARGYHLADDDSWLYDSSVTFMIDGAAGTATDLVGMAAAVGMTLYVCEQLDLPFESRHYSPSCPDVHSYARNRHKAATLCWCGGDRLRYPRSMLATGLRSSDYRQTLAKCLRWKTDDQVSSRTVAPIGFASLAANYMLFWCHPTQLDLIQILLRAGANPMVQFGIVPFGNVTREQIFWDTWLQLLLELRKYYMAVNGVSSGILLVSKAFDEQVTSKEIFDLTKALLVQGADINYQLCPRLSRANISYLRRPLATGRFDLQLACSAIFVLEECFNIEPEFREFASAMEPLVTTPIRKILQISRFREGGSSTANFSPSAGECGMLWPLIEKCESTGRPDDMDSLQTALEGVWEDHKAGYDSGSDWISLDEDDGCDDEDDDRDEERGNDDSDGEVGAVG